jgi:hypothetical protein
VSASDEPHETVTCPECDGDGETDNPDGGQGRFECANCEGIGSITKAQAVHDEIVSAVLAEVAWQDQQGVEFGYITGDHTHERVQIHNAAVGIREAIRLRTEGA